MWTDALGNPVTLDGGEASRAAVDDFVQGFIGSQSRAVNVLAAAEDTSPLVQAYCAAVHMFAEAPQAPANARPFIERALAGCARATAREARFIHAVHAWVERDLPRAIALHEEQAAEHPRDLASLKLGQYHLFNRGDAPGMLRIALRCRDAAADVPYLHGMLAFGWEQCHALEQAESHARQAIALQRAEPWAHHALAHVMLTQGRVREGHAFLADVSETWVGLNSFMLTHNWWHQALFALELDDAAQVLDLYDRRVWGVACDYSQDQANAVSLLARMELAGIDVSDRWQELARWLAPRTCDQVLPFLDLHYLLGLARAGRPEAAQLLRNLESHAARAPDHARPAWEVAASAARGLQAWAHGEHGEAVRWLGPALPRMLQTGGSHAQRDLFEQIHLDALERSGHGAAAQHLLQPRLRQQPESLRLRRQAQRLYGALGLSGCTHAFL